jgi:hypothetical protein
MINTLILLKEIEVKVKIYFHNQGKSKKNI